MLGVKWEPDMEDPNMWKNLPAETAEFRLVQLNSDPPFNSHSGYETRHSAADLVNSDGVPHVKYNFNPPLDGDIVDTHNHLDGSESRLGHTFNPESDSE